MAQPKPQIILIAYFFPPSPEMGGNRPYRFYKYLKRMGFPCHVITASDQERNGQEDVTFLADHFRAIWDSPTKQRLSLRAWMELIIRKFMFPGHIGLMWSIEVAERCRQLMRANPENQFLIICTYPPLGVLVAGLLLSLSKRVPWIADFRDPIAGFTGEHIFVYGHIWDYFLERFVFRTAAAVIANVEGAAQMWRLRYPWATPKLHVILNGFDPEDSPRARDIPSREAKVIVHAGTLYGGRNPNMLIESLLRLRSKNVREAFSVQIVLLGASSTSAGLNSMLYAEAQSQGWLELQGTVPKPEALRIIAEADGLLLLQPQSDIQIPGKAFEYICIGRPVLALLRSPSHLEQLLTDAGVPHICVYADDNSTVVDRKIIEFLRLPTSPVLYSDWFREKFNAQSQTAQLASILEAVQIPKKK